MSRICILFAAVALGSLPLSAQDLLIRNAKVHTVDTRGTLNAADVLVRAGRIVKVGTGLVAGAGTSVIDAAGKPLTPAFFAGVTALGIEEVSLEPSTVDHSYSPGASASPMPALPRPEFDVQPAFNPESMVIGVNRVEGFGFAMVAPSSQAGGSIFSGIGAVARLDGRIDAFDPASRTLVIDLGSDTASLTGNTRAGQYMLLDQAIREAIGGSTLKERDYQLLTPTGRDVLSSFLHGRVAFKVDRAADIRQVLALSNRTGMHAVIVGGAEAWKVAGLLATAKVPVLIDGLVNLPDSFDQLGASLENAARLQAAGVQIAFTQSGDATHNARKVRQSAGNAVAHGLPWEAALAALTREPAAIFGLGDKLGRIAPGLEADLVLWSGDPLEVTSMAEQMWISGRPQSMRSRQTELRDRYRPR